MHTVGVDVAALAAEADVRAAAGQTPMYVAVDGTLTGLVAVADTVKDTSAEAVAQLEALGLEVWMLTGDNAATAAAIASSVGIDRVVADVLPAEKAAHVQRLQEQGHVVGFVGDGINDAPALATADLGIAIGTGTDVAIAASDITLVGGDLRGITAAIALSRRTVRTIKQGLGWAFSYNILLIPVAAGALYWWDRLLLDPVLASAAMAMSSVSVVSNALRLRRFERPETAAAILQPKLSARVGDYAFLATVAAIALTLGTVFTWASRTETASHGMNGLLAWTEGMGMPMRPAMSVMETTDTPPISAHDAGLRVTLHAGRRPHVWASDDPADHDPRLAWEPGHRSGPHPPGVVPPHRDPQGRLRPRHLRAHPPPPDRRPGAARGHHDLPDPGSVRRARRGPPPGLHVRRAVPDQPHRPRRSASALDPGRPRQRRPDGHQRWRDGAAHR